MTPQRSNPEEIKVHVGESVFKITRSRLGTYIDLNTVFEALIKAVPTGDNSAIADCLFEYLSIAIPNFDRGLFESAPWYEIMMAFNMVQQTNAIPHADRYAILNVRSGEEETLEEVPWSYPGRNLFVWKHSLAKAYGWTLDEIDNLWPEQAIQLLMEIAVDEQFAMEFKHQLSELAYEYDKNTKQSRYKPLRRPLWMISGSERSQDEKKQSLLTKLRRDSLPLGKVIGAENGKNEE
jgi:hypothetical protein